MAQTFLIRHHDQFLESWDGKSLPVWTSVPSLAAHFEYSDADDTVQDLQEKGWPCAVSDRFGNDATVDVIRRELNQPRIGGLGVVLASDPEYLD
jgi:hypothetical protein